MTAIILRSLPAAAAFASFMFWQLAQGATADQGPFAKVPAFSTACYKATDPFLGRLDAARQAVQADREKQTATNAKIEEDFNNIDGMEKSQRMQQWMMENPQEAMKFAQASQAMGGDTQTVMPALNADSTKFDAERKDLARRYKAAMDQAQAPANARMDALSKKLEATGCGFGTMECDKPAWAWTELDAVLRMRDAAYQAACPNWWGANGEMQSYFRRWRDWMTTKYLPEFAKIDALRMQQYAIMNSPAATYRSTLPHEKADEFMREAWTLYETRLDKPWCTAQACERGSVWAM